MYNGNIAETFWRSRSDNVQRKYSYQYDALNRLSNAIYQKPENTVPVTNMYNESMSYDKNGNITSLQRNGDLDSDEGSVSAFTIDELTYFYSPTNPNQLMKVDDEAYCTLGFKNGINTDDDYSYDDNGNLTLDKNKNISLITYNHLNLPTKIQFGSGARIEYLYTATGQKLRKDVLQNIGITATDYLDGFQYVNNVLQFFPTAEGYVTVNHCEMCDPNSGNGQNRFSYVYQYKDHLGNIRMSYGWDERDHIVKTIEENHYYPFGLKHTNYNAQKRKYVEFNPEDYEQGEPIVAGKLKLAQVSPADGIKNLYLYNSKEFQDELGLGWYAYGYRHYDPAIARWTTMDPLINDLDFTFDPNDADTDDEIDFATETTLSNGGGIYNTDNLNPYSYGYNDPVRFDDPDGRCPVCLFVAAAFLYSEFSHAPTGDKKLDSKNYNANAGNRTLVSKAIVGGGLAKKIISISSNSAKAKATEKAKEKAKTLKQNKEKGKKFEQKTIKNLKKDKSRENVQEQVTIRPNGGNKNVRLDAVSKKDGEVSLTEIKSSETAPLTPNQKEGFPLIEQNGGTVVGQGKPGFEGGTVIPPTKIEIIRP